MTLGALVELACRKENFQSLDAYLNFARCYLDFADNAGNLQAVIVSQNEEQYRFYQYKRDGHFNITRPINSDLMLSGSRRDLLASEFLNVLDVAPDISANDALRRQLICHAIYTIQQCIGAALDALPARQSNTARKINGDLFERLIRLLIQRLGVDCTSGTINVPVITDGVEAFRISYQHDLIVKSGEAIKAIGSVKTSSKDRIDKIFVDKFLYERLTGENVPHVAIFLNDVQRKAARLPNRYGINATFLPGRFKGYTVKLNPLDGVYYCDIRPNMTTDDLLKQHIRTIDHFSCDDLWRFVPDERGNDRGLPKNKK